MEALSAGEKYSIVMTNWRRLFEERWIEEKLIKSA